MFTMCVFIFDSRTTIPVKMSKVETALSAIRTENMSIRAAARKYGVPNTTLQRHINGNHSERKACTVLTSTEENEIVQWILDVAQVGFPITASELKDCVQLYLDMKERKTLFKDNRPGRNWFTRFLKRHKNLSIRLAENLCKSRAAVTEEMIRNWFTEVSDTNYFHLFLAHFSRLFVRFRII